MHFDSLHDHVKGHLAEYFAGHPIELFTWELGPIVETLPEFQVARIAPGPKCSLWTYVSIGASEIEHADVGRHEFLLTTPFETPRAVELLAMVSHRHVSDPLGSWHILPIGEPWLEDATCDVFFFSPPYPFGRALEICNLVDDHLHILWMLPITQTEREFAKAEGAEALEVKFEEAELEYWRIDRPSVV
ncbi:hypothetical protein C5Y96_26930 [Blastopirellula marina]|uniref:Suppressor of fused-like domain-containing protein n=1 Tax=Blastopirellula marina TaxID=124 RepID=A0A2S8EYY2_9BACT|nr:MULTISPECIES: suppressor of fused domain protein [Pirellulaceae]PQO25136.1 hypothetical protein C5Y96_26930 [Blastopirellula marina]RCS40987.1 suppressor of fused domain protein [Bremerella cremea]